MSIPHSWLIQKFLNMRNSKTRNFLCENLTPKTYTSNIWEIQNWETKLPRILNTKNSLSDNHIWYKIKCDNTQNCERYSNFFLGTEIISFTWDTWYIFIWRYMKIKTKMENHSKALNVTPNLQICKFCGSKYTWKSGPKWKIF